MDLVLLNTKQLVLTNLLSVTNCKYNSISRLMLRLILALTLQCSLNHVYQQCLITECITLAHVLNTMGSSKQLTYIFHFVPHSYKVLQILTYHTLLIICKDKVLEINYLVFRRVVLMLMNAKDPFLH